MPDRQGLAVLDLKTGIFGKITLININIMFDFLLSLKKLLQKFHIYDILYITTDILYNNNS
jgi:hypothetical protein